MLVDLPCIMDRYIYVLSVDNGSHLYDGKVWCESIDNIISLNGVLVNGRSLGLGCIKKGDKILYRWKNQNWKGRVVSSCRRRRRNSEPSIIPATLKRVKVEDNQVSQRSGGDPPGKPAEQAINVPHSVKDTQRGMSKVYVRVCIQLCIKYVCVCSSSTYRNHLFSSHTCM